jgi:hypothetical protein
MSQLQQHRLAELIGLGRGDPGGGKPVLPGFYVKHKKFERSFGLVVGMVHDFGYPTQVMVLWSKQPSSIDEDVEYFQQKLYAALKIPPSMLGAQ